MILTDDNFAVMDANSFANLDEYSLSLPTGTYVGKRWKKLFDNGAWWMGEYVDVDTPGVIGIAWRKILIA